MPTNQPNLRSAWPRLLPVLAGLLLALMLAACGPGTPVAVSPAPSASATSAPATDPTVQRSGDLADVPVGVDADGNFYRGDPNAPVKLVEFSEFQ